MPLASMFQKSQCPEYAWILDLIGKKELGDWYDNQMKNANDAKIKAIGEELGRGLSSLKSTGQLCKVMQPALFAGVKIYTKSMLDDIELGNGVVRLPSPD